MSYTIGSVPYLNAKPLVRLFEERPELGVRVVYEVPSRLPALLDSGEAQAVLVSSVEALRVPGRVVAGGVSISSRGPVESVRLFSKVEPSAIRTLALDQSSLTSNFLAQAILTERYQCWPDLKHMAPGQDAMLAAADACLLIGDPGMRASSEGLKVLDLGAEWQALTGLPFVWAMWVGSTGLDARLAAMLKEAMSYGQFHAKRIAREEAAVGGWDNPTAERYLTQVINYELPERHLRGLAAFRERLQGHRLLESSYWPEILDSRPPVMDFSQTMQEGARYN